MATAPTTESRYAPAIAADGLLLAEALSEIAERAQCLTGATGVVIALRRANEIIVRTSDGIAPEVGARIPFPSGITGLCITTKKTQTCADPDAEAQMEAAFRAIKVRSIMSMPVQWDGGVRGVLAVLSQAEKAFNSSHVAILMALRDVVATKLSRSEPPMEPLQVPALEPEIDLSSLLQTPAPERVSPPPMAPAKAIPAKPIAEPPKDPAPIAVAANPDVLGFSEDPTMYASVVKPKPLPGPALRSPAVEVVAATHTAERVRERNSAGLIVGLAAAVILASLGVVLYLRHKSAPAPNVVPASVAFTPTPVVTPPAPVTSETSVASAAAQPTTVTPEPVASSSPAVKHEETKPTPEPKHVAEKAQEPVAILQLSTGKPAAKPEEPIEPPALNAMAGNVKALPDLPAAAAPKAALVANQSVLIPASRLQGRPPEYPAQAKLLHRYGIVKLHIAISAEGKVTEARVLSGDPYLSQASVRAVRDWTYRPAQLNGQPVPSATEVSIEFRGE